jgi:hypothetical protein
MKRIVGIMDRRLCIHQNGLTRRSIEREGVGVELIVDVSRIARRRFESRKTWSSHIVRRGGVQDFLTDSDSVEGGMISKAAPRARISPSSAPVKLPVSWSTDCFAHHKHAIPPRLGYRAVWPKMVEMFVGRFVNACI